MRLDICRILAHLEGGVECDIISIQALVGDIKKPLKFSGSNQQKTTISE